MRSTIQLRRFDAHLDTDVCDRDSNMQLTLTLRLGFNQINPSGTAAEGTYHDYGRESRPERRIIRWTDGTWANWKRHFVTTAQNFWNGKFWLINPSPTLFAFDDGGTTYIPNTYCRIRIIAQDGTSRNNHHTISVVRLHSSENWFGSHATLYDSLDTQSTRKGENDDGTPIMQRAHVHEVGHLLGLGHVDEGETHCPTDGDTNAAACYGLTDHDQNSVMGQGMQLRREHARPWQTAMRRFAQVEAVRPSRARILVSVVNPGLGAAMGANALIAASRNWDVKMQRHYPRTPEEVNAGTLRTQPRPANAGAQ